MGLARGLERRLEQLVDGLAARLFRGRIHPVELATRIVREADLAAFETPVGPGAPNAFTITLGGETEPEDAIAAAVFELEAVMTDAAAERGWRLEGPVSVRIAFGDGPASSAAVEATVEPGPIPAWAQLINAKNDAIEVGANRAVIGRSSDADVHLSNDEVSRQHALLWREAGTTWLVDLGSSNGTSVNGVAATSAVDLIDGDRLAFGATEFTFRVL